MSNVKNILLVSIALILGTNHAVKAEPPFILPENRTGIITNDFGNGLTDNAPGVEVLLDYTPFINSSDILDIERIAFSFEANSNFDRLRIQLSDMSEFTIDSSNRLQLEWHFYNSAYVDPDTITSSFKSPMTSELINELMDGIFSANIWVENDQEDWVGPSSWILGGAIVYVTPEPASMGILFVGGLCLACKKKRIQ